MLALLFAALAGGAALAQDGTGGTAEETERLQEIERSLEADRERAEALQRQADALAAEITALQTEMVAAAASAQEHEAELSQLERRLALLQEREADKTAALARHQTQLTQTLGALQRLSIQPPEALILGPESPIDTVRSATLLQVAIPALREQALDLQQEVDELHSLRDEVERRTEEIAATGTTLEAEKERIEALIERKRSLQQTTAGEQVAAAKRVAALAREAKDLRELVERLAAEPPPLVLPLSDSPQVALLIPPAPPDRSAAPQAAPDATEPAQPETVQPTATMRLTPPEHIRTFPTTRASLTAPARGKLMTRFGEPSNVGLNSKGITIATRSEAQVVAPFDGQIVFRGPFRGYGEILIMEHRGGYHTLIVGLGRTDAVVGQWLLAGEPVGLMGLATDGNPELYLELRHGGEPIDPLPWLMTRDTSEVE